MLAESYLHDLSPFLLRISGEIGLRWYGLAYLAGFLVAGQLIARLVKTGRSPLARRNIDPGSLLTTMVAVFEPQAAAEAGECYSAGLMLKMSK